MTFRRASAQIAIGALLLSMAGWVHAQQGQPTPSPGGPPASSGGQTPAVQVDAGSLVGSAVRSSDGRDIGKVSRLMLDPKDGRVVTVVITRGGTLGMGGETVSVPWTSVRVGQDDRNLVLTVDQQILEPAPAASPRGGDQKSGEQKDGQPKR